MKRHQNVAAMPGGLRNLVGIVVLLLMASCVATPSRDFAVTPFYSGHVTDAFTGEPLGDVLIHVATLRRVPSDAVTVTTNAEGRYSAGVLGDSAWSVTLASPLETICRARITFIRPGYVSQSLEDAGPCSRSPKTLDVALAQSK
jgi:hypothetical protein